LTGGGRGRVARALSVGFGPAFHGTTVGLPLQDTKR
jgi:hypothetical protein